MKFKILNNICFEVLHEFKVEFRLPKHLVDIDNTSDNIVKLPNGDIYVLRIYLNSNEILSYDDIKCDIERRKSTPWINSDDKEIWLKYNFELLDKLVSCKRDYKIESILRKEELNIIC